MTQFYVKLKGTWSFCYAIEATTEEEAINLAVRQIDEESGSIDLTHEKQSVEEEKGSDEK